MNPDVKNDCFALPPGVNWVPVDEVLTHFDAHLSCLSDIEIVSLSEASGRFLANNPIARRGHPAYANSAIDGYGFSGACDGELPLQTGAAQAGASLNMLLKQGHAVRILTGAPIPKGVDRIILQELVEIKDGHLLFQGPIKTGANIRPAGEDVSIGDVLGDVGMVIQPQDLAHFASAGITELSVFKKLKVGIISTGDEIKSVGDDLKPHEMIDANRPMLLDLIGNWGMEPVDLGIVKDDKIALNTALNLAKTKVDVVLSTGGISAGDRDYMSQILSDEGQYHLWRIAIKPGRPMGMALWKNMPIFGLPGNPVAAFVCTLMLVRPALLKLAGGRVPTPISMQVPAAFKKNKKAGRREYLRARLTKEGTVEIYKSEGSGMIKGLSWATGLVELPDKAMDITQGMPVLYYPFSSFNICG